MQPSPRLVAFAKALAGLSFVALAATTIAPPGLPDWVPFAVWTVGATAGFFAGVPAPQFAPQKALVPMAWAPSLMGASGALVTLASQQPPGGLQTAVLLASKAVAYLAGRAMPSGLPAGG
jgi:hypothetical protein